MTQTKKPTLGDWLSERLWDDQGRSPVQIQDVLDSLNYDWRDIYAIEDLVRAELEKRYGAEWKNIPAGPLEECHGQ